MPDTIQKARNVTSGAPVNADCSSTVQWRRKPPQSPSEGRQTKTTTLKMPSLEQLLASSFSERRHLLFPWLREQESCMVYAETGVGKSLFALSAALAVAGGGEFLDWRSDQTSHGGGWRVLYVDGEMHIADVQERLRLLLDAIPGIDKAQAGRNLRYLARQHQDPSADFPVITDEAGMAFYLSQIRTEELDLVILDNFSTLGEVEDENAASSFNAIQAFLLRLKTAGVATMLVHHAGKSGDFRGSSKLSATFETIIRLERPAVDAGRGEARFRVVWDKVRSGGPGRHVREAVATLDTIAKPTGGVTASWTYESGNLGRLDEMRLRLEAGEFVFQTEIADLFGISKMQVTKDIRRGIQLGMFTEFEVRRWLAKGKAMRAKGKTEAPVRLAELEAETEVNAPF